MSAEFDLALIRASSQLWLFTFASSKGSVCFGSLCCAFFCYMLLCYLQHRLNLWVAAASMRLRPKRTYSGVECFGGFHIKRFFYLFLFFRGDLT
ncbi:hypothetical protein MANES_06G069000v8 [Manihot esculenta]|uniref:Uncharacterized protein n=1 Tax=Manihot esculenta TaxID=3983 RepID=A0A2C9VPY4_MANES|nr:hypothetical protein MANES_06G069000v8 [Manihot esculenta]